MINLAEIRLPREFGAGMYGVLYLDETTFNDRAITALSNSAIDRLVSLLALSNTLQYLPLLLFL